MLGMMNRLNDLIDRLTDRLTDWRPSMYRRVDVYGCIDV